MDEKIKNLLLKMKFLIIAISCWSKLNRLAGFPADIYDSLMELEREIKEMEKENG